MNVVLLEPEIPANTGNIGRTCVATGTTLHLIKPLGFSLDEKALKRAGLDYWQHLDVRVYENFNDFLEKNPDASKKLYLATTKGHHVYSDAQYDEDAYLMFGKESAGIPAEVGTAITGTSTIPPTTLGSAPSIPATATTTLACSIRCLLFNNLCMPATPTS